MISLSQMKSILCVPGVGVLAHKPNLGDQNTPAAAEGEQPQGGRIKGSTARSERIQSLPWLRACSEADSKGGGAQRLLQGSLPIPAVGGLPLPSLQNFFTVLKRPGRKWLVVECWS